MLHNKAQSYTFEEADVTTKDSFVGPGLGYFPVGFERPNNMDIMLQLNLEDFTLSKFPQKGILQLWAKDGYAFTGKNNYEDHIFVHHIDSSIKEQEGYSTRRFFSKEQIKMIVELKNFYDEMDWELFEEEPKNIQSTYDLVMMEADEICETEEKYIVKISKLCELGINNEEEASIFIKNIKKASLKDFEGNKNSLINIKRFFSDEQIHYITHLYELYPEFGHEFFNASDTQFETAYDLIISDAKISDSANMEELHVIELSNIYDLNINTEKEAAIFISNLKKSRLDDFEEIENVLTCEDRIYKITPSLIFESNPEQDEDSSLLNCLGGLPYFIEDEEITKDKVQFFQIHNNGNGEIGVGIFHLLIDIKDLKKENLENININIFFD
jgi:hypothetical protein